MNYENIGKFIQEKRKEKKLTQKELAQKIGVTDKAVSKWERGLGCPDVSILEILSKELGVSILEILKGRIIENEVIKVTETNDYITETIKYTKNNFKEVINKIIVFIIISVSLLLFILNIENIISMNKKYEHNYETEIHNKIKENVKKIEKNTNSIKYNKGKYKKEDYEQICRILEENIDILKKITLINGTGIKKYTKNEIYLLDSENIPFANLINLTKIIEKYENKTVLEETIVDNILAQLYLGGETFYNDSYKYKLIKTTKEEIPVVRDDILYSRVLKIKSTISTYLYITEQIIEIGEINE